MSGAFVKESDGTDVFEVLPDRTISTHPNYVTRNGLAHIEAEISRLQGEFASAQSIGDRGALARLARDLRYWTARRSNAQVIEPESDNLRVQFGSSVTVARQAGRTQTFCIVGEDEANPKIGTLSHASPVARALIGKKIGETVLIGGEKAEIIGVGKRDLDSTLNS
jgi:transcription elongation GreA/GreB family factor